VAYAPLLGRVHAGDAQEPDILDERIPLPAEVYDAHPSSYFLQVEGNCMSRVYPEGCHILIDPEQEPQNGSIAVVSIDGADYVMRRLYRGATTLVLSPDSWDDGFEDIVIKDTDEHTVEFHGTVVWFQSSKEME
jgi:repressor LexA